MTINPEQRRSFEEVGWFHVGAVFGFEELAKIRGEYDRILASSIRIGETSKTP